MMSSHMTQDGPIDHSGFRSVPPKSKSLQSVQILMAVLCGIGGILLLFYFSTDRPTTVIASRGFGSAAAMFVAGGLGFVYIWTWRRNVRLLIGPDRVGYQDIFRRRHYWLRGQIDRAVDMMVIYAKSAQPQRAVYLIAPDGKRAVALNTRAWSADDVQAFIEASGAANDHRDQPLTAAEARRQFPNAFGWGSQHVALGTTITIILALVLAVGGFLVWTVLSGH